MTTERDGHIGFTLRESRSSSTGPPFDPDRSNVVVIVLDDLGFAQLGCYGSDLDTPNIDALAARGVRASNFHTTGMCSPTRASLLTGRNHHRVGMGMLPDLPVDYPAYDGQFPRGAGTLAQVLRSEGYATGAIGKWHLVPRDQRATGPFHMWPTGLGFERYYGFLNGETNQWAPNLVRDQTHVEPPRTPEEGYHLEADLADEAVRWLRDLRLHQPSRPYFLWYATAAPHAPHQAPPEWIDRYRGCFDEGWDVWRERRLAAQIAAGLVPADTELSPRPSWVEPWADIDADRRRLYARMMEAFAGFLSFTDHQIGRVLAAIDDRGDGDDTLVVLLSDNGCSAEGGPNGSWNQLRHYLGDEPDDLEAEMSHLDDLGGFDSHGHYPWGWALAGNTPFRRWKRYTFEGGVRDPFIIAGPGVDDPGGVRSGYFHAVDVAPTVLDLVGIDWPDEIDGHRQLSLDGVSIRDLLADPAAPDPRRRQYYELWGSRAMYLDGWKAVTNHVNQLTAAERDNLEGSARFEDDRWHLYDTTTDHIESHDRAGGEPERLAAMVAAWDEEAERNQVLPLSDDREARVEQLHLPWLEWQPTISLRPGDKVHESHAPVLWGGFRMIATFDAPLDTTSTGVLCEQGDHIAGWAWYLAEGHSVWVLTFDGTTTRVSSPIAGAASLLAVEGDGNLDGGLTVTMRVGDAVAPSVDTATGVPLAIAPDGAFLTVGYGRPFPVSADYRPPAPAPAAFRGLRIDVGPPPPFDFEAEFARAMRHQ